MLLKGLQACMSGVDPVNDALVMNIQDAANRTKAVAFVYHFQAQSASSSALCGMGTPARVKGGVATTGFALEPLRAIAVETAFDQTLVMAV